MLSLRRSFSCDYGDVLEFVSIAYAIGAYRRFSLEIGFVFDYLEIEVESLVDIVPQMDLELSYFFSDKFRNHF